MTEDEKIIRHLEMIQGIINRLGRNSLLVKLGSIAIVISGKLISVIIYYILSHKKIYLSSDVPFMLMLDLDGIIILFIIIGFWILDGYYLWRERLFRYHYDTIRIQEDTDFNMDVSTYYNRPYSKWRSAIFSVTLTIFYVIEIGFILFLPIIVLNA